MPHRPLVAVIVLALSLGACAGDAPPSPDVGPEADSARALLGRVSPELASASFRRLEESRYEASLRVEDVGELATLRHFTGPAPAGTDSLHVVNPVAQLVGDDAPHLDPRMRDRFVFRLLPEVAHNGRRLAGAEASVPPTNEREPVRRIRSWADAATGAPYAVEVWRVTRSAIFDEDSRAGVFFADGPAPLPRAATSESRIDVPMGEPRHVRIDLAVRPLVP